jgi:ankyrin repeat protein
MRRRPLLWLSLARRRLAAVNLAPTSACVVAACASAAAATTVTAAGCLAGQLHNPKGLPDPEWYEEQNAHIALNLSLVEEAKQGWWHEVTRRLRDKNLGEDVNAKCPRNGESLLHLAARAGRRRLCEELLCVHGAENQARDSRGRTPLLSCAEHGSEVVAATLVAHGADVNAQDASGATALSIAARLGHVRLVRWLLARRSDLREPLQADLYGAHALHKAVSFGHVGCVEALLSDGRVRAAVDKPVGPVHHSVPSSFEAKSGRETALQLAASHTYHFHHTSHTRIARSLLAAGADPNVRSQGGHGRTAVHCAAAAGNAGVLRELIASKRVLPSTWEARDAHGRTARELANGDVAILELLGKASSHQASQHQGRESAGSGHTAH